MPPGVVGHPPEVPVTRKRKNVKNLGDIRELFSFQDNPSYHKDAEGWNWFRSNHNWREVSSTARLLTGVQSHRASCAVTHSSTAELSWNGNSPSAGDGLRLREIPIEYPVAILHPKGAKSIPRRHSETEMPPKAMNLRCLQALEAGLETAAPII
jgi:hypothetical protein